jgi:predicted transcriptional regulator
MRFAAYQTAMKNLPEPKRRGRPRGSVAGDGERQAATITMRPATRARLKILSALKNQPPWVIVEEAISMYIRSLEPRERGLVEPLAKSAADHAMARQSEGS